MPRSATGDAFARLLDAGWTQQGIADALGYRDSRMVRYALAGDKPLRNMLGAARALEAGDQMLAGERAVLSRRATAAGDVARTRGHADRAVPLSVQSTPAGTIIRGGGRSGMVALGDHIAKMGGGARVTLRITFASGYAVGRSGDPAAPAGPIDVELGGHGGIRRAIQLPDGARPLARVHRGTPHQTARALGVLATEFGVQEGTSLGVRVSVSDASDVLAFIAHVR